VELEVDSPPGSPRISSPNGASASASELLITANGGGRSIGSKKSDLFSVSALLRRDEPPPQRRTPRSPPLGHLTSSGLAMPFNPLEAMRQGYPPNYDAAMFQRPLFSPALPFFAAVAFHQGQQQQQQQQQQQSGLAAG